jgi:hypothetical protein
MSPVIAFVTGLFLTMGLVFVALLYLRNPLQAILTDLCGTVERARFWKAFSNITLFFVPMALALDSRPMSGDVEPPVFAIGDQLEHAVIGLVAAVIIVGMVLSRYIPKHSVARDAHHIDQQQSDS